MAPPKSTAAEEFLDSLMDLVTLRLEDKKAEIANTGGDDDDDGDVDQLSVLMGLFEEAVETMGLTVPDSLDFNSSSSACLCIPHLWVLTILATRVRVHRLTPDGAIATQVARGVLKHCPDVQNRDIKDDEIRGHFVTVAMVAHTVFHAVENESLDPSTGFTMMESSVNLAHKYIYDLLISHAPKIDAKNVSSSDELRHMLEMATYRHPFQKLIIRLRLSAWKSKSSSNSDTSGGTSESKSRRNRSRALRRIANRKAKQATASASASPAQGKGKKAPAKAKTTAGSGSSDEL